MGTPEEHAQEVCVLVISLDSGAEVERIGPMSPHAAERVMRGVLINLNQDEYFVDIRPASELYF